MLTALTNSWYTVASASIWKDSEGTYHHFTTHRGTTQGCTMSAAIFAIALQPTLHKIRDAVNRNLTHHNQLHDTQHRCHLHAYLDDMYLAVPTQHLQHALTTVEAEVKNAQLILNNTKTEMSSTGPPHPDYAASYTKTFTIMGTTPTELKAAAEDDQVPLETLGTPLDDITPHDTLLITQAHALTKLTAMHSQQNIDTQTAMTILRNINNHIPIYRARSHLLPIHVTQAWDHNTAMTIEYLLQTKLTPQQHLQTQLPIHLGGMGMLELTHRSAAAFLGSWQSFATKSSNNYTDATFKHHFPQATTHIEEAHQRIHRFLPPGHPTPTWTHWTTNAHELSQSTLSKHINNQQYDDLHANTTVLHQTILDNMHGPGNGAWIYPNPLSTQSLPEIHYVISLKLRLGIVIHTPNEPCQHNTNGTQCGQPLDTHAHHSLTCSTGPHRTKRHDNIKHTLNKWTKQHGYHTLVERHVPALDHVTPDGTLKKGIMDIVATQDTQTWYIDVSVTSPLTTETVEHDQPPPSKNPTLRREQDKRRKYNQHPNLHPFVMTTYGKLGHDAITLLRRMAPTDAETRSESLNTIYHDIATTLQHGNAESILASQPTPHPTSLPPPTPLTTPTFLSSALVALNTSMDVRPITTAPPTAAPESTQTDQPPRKRHHGCENYDIYDETDME
jgi:hypothetical protein